MYKLRFCTSFQLVQEICTSCNLYKLQHVQILDLYKFQLVQAPYFSVEQGILMNLYFKIHKINISDGHDEQTDCTSCNL